MTLVERQQNNSNSYFFAPTSSQRVKLLRMELLFWCPTWTPKREGKYMPHSAPAWLPPYLWTSLTLLWLPLSTWLVSWSCTVALQVGVWFTQVEYKGPWTLPGDGATFVIWLPVKPVLTRHTEGDAFLLVVHKVLE